MNVSWREHLPRALAALLLGGALALTGCTGDDGSDGAPGADGQSAYEVAVANGFTGTEQEWLVQAQDVGPEVCSFCHNGEVARNGETHQEMYDELFQHGVVVVSNVAYDGSDGANDIVTFDMTKNGADFDCREADSVNIRFSEYDAASRRFSSIDTNADGAIDLLSIKGTLTYDGAGGCTSTNSQSDLGDLSAVNGLIAVYGQDEQVESIGHITLAKYPFADLLETGATGVDYVSAANATGCENCHQTPYYKHGYIRADISGVGDNDFWTCKVCHVDNRDGGHPDWQIAVNDPQRWAEIFNGTVPITDAEKTQYGYKTRLMNDVHMSHSMEFPYPQPIRTCATCHAGKLTQTLSDENFVIETCISCHPVAGGTDTADADGNFAVDTTDMALKTIWENHGVSAIHVQGDGSVTTTTCNTCHSAAGGAPVFSALHTGYEPRIYYKDTDGTYKHYRDAITASIDEVTLTGNVLDIKFSAAGTAGSLSATDVSPTVQVSFYGYDTKDFILSNHTRNAAGNRMEKTIGTDNPLFTEVDGSAPDWEVTLDLAAYAGDPADFDLIAAIASGVVKKAEVIVRPRLENAGGETLGLNAVSKTVDVTADGTDAFVDNYFQGTNALVKVTDGCNRCHDQLAITFHSADRGGSIVVCRSCHVVTSGGSHLEGQSRSIDSYVHAIHKFQAFDVDNIDFTDPVEAAKYEEHIEFLFPDFATINCERCHTEERAVDAGSRGTFDIPDQSKSMPGLLSGTDEISGMAIPETPAVVVGPAARACGGCHRAEALEEDDLGGYVAFNEHAKRFGYRVENDSDNNMLNTIISYIMGMFQ